VLRIRDQGWGKKSGSWISGMNIPDAFSESLETVFSSVPDPDHQAKIVRKTSVPSVLRLLLEFLSLKNYVNGPYL
jgi:hypothetical protein